MAANEISLNEYLEPDIEGAEGIECFSDFEWGNPDDPGTSPRWRISDESGASWAMRRLASTQAKIDEHCRTARAEEDRIGAWLDTVNGPLVNSVDFFKGLLIEWQAEKIEKDLGVNVLRENPDPEQWEKYRAKTSKLPTGDVSARVSPGRFESSDPASTIEFLMTVGRDELLVQRDPIVGATPFEEGIRGQMVRMIGDRYQVIVATDEIVDLAVAQAIHALLTDGRGNEAAVVQTVLDTFVELCPKAQPFKDDRPSLTIHGDVGESAWLCTWLQIPGVRKLDVGKVTINVKPTVTP